MSTNTLPHATLSPAELVQQYRHLPQHVASKLFSQEPLVKRYGYPDAIQAGHVALIHAARLWNPERGVRFLTYAYKAIVNEIRKVAFTDNIIRLPCYLQKGYENGKYRLREEDVVRALACQTVSFRSANHRGKGEGSDNEIEPEAPAKLSPTEVREDQERLQKALRKLLPRWRQLIRMRFGLAGSPPMTLAEVGRVLDLTRERVRQLQAKALARLRTLLTDD